MQQNNHFTIIIPTYCEAQNIPALIKRIANVNFSDHQFEVIIIDDNSHDETIEIVTQLISTYSWLRLIVRKNERSLSASILDGFIHATFPIVITMDADLSHPPEKINDLLYILNNSNAEVVIGSRYVKGGSIDASWSMKRKMASRVSAFIAKSLLVPKVTDPLSGFLAIRKEKVLAKIPYLEPIGWKIGLEIMVKCHCKNIYEIPIHFAERSLGKSKLNLKIAFSYFYHIIRLLQYKYKNFKG